MRLSAATGALFSVLLLVPLVAHADPSFVLTDSTARAGDAVHFTISGTEEGATYTLEVGGSEVAQGSDGDGDGVSGQFTMPDLGDTSGTVTVEAQITRSDEETVLVQTLQYVAPSRGTTGPGAGQLGMPTAAQVGAGTTGPNSTPSRPVSPVAPGPAEAPRLRSQKRRRSASRRTRGRSRARRPTHRSPQRRASERRHGGERGPGRRPAPASGSSARTATAPRGGDTNSGSINQSNGGRGRRPDSGPGLGGTGPPTALLTVPPSAPAIFSLTSGISGEDSAGASLTAVLIFALLVLAALVLARSLRAGAWRPVTAGWGAEDDDEEILRGTVHVPDSGGTSRFGWHLARTVAIGRSTRRRRRARVRAADAEGDHEVLKGAVHDPGSHKASRGPRA